MIFSHTLRYFTIFIVIIISSKWNTANSQITFFPEFTFSGQFATPFFKMAQRGSSPSETGNAVSGFQLGAKAAHRMYRSPSWTISVKTGFLNLFTPSENTNTKTLEINNWRGSYLMPGFQYEKGKRMRFGVGFSAGLLFNKSWSGYRKEDFSANDGPINTYNYKSKVGVGAGVSPELNIIFQITKEVHLVGMAEYFWGVGSRLTDVAASTTIMGQKTSTGYTITSKAPINYLALGVGLRFKLHRF